MAMTSTFEVTTVEQLQGNIEHEGRILQRTPLHVDYGHAWAPATELKTGEIAKETRFNAIGSRCIGSDMHLPVLDVDGGVRLTQRGKCSKAVLTAAHEGYYHPDSDLRDVLGDHGIELEVFGRHDYAHGRSHMFGGAAYKGMMVASLVLRAGKGMLDAVLSTSREHSHLYINEPFSNHDHAALLEGLAKTGIVGSYWQKRAMQEGMGVVRTPWTVKKQFHPSS